MAALMAQILGALPTGPLREKILTWPGEIGPEAASVPLRLAAGFHALVLSGRIEPIFTPGDWQSGLPSRLRAAAQMQETFLLEWLDHAPQTNEVGRSGVLILAARALSRRYGLPLRLSELGASAGLNLGFDRYGLHLGDRIIGARESAVRLSPTWRCTPPDGQDFQITDRRGCDLNPLDPKSDQLRLLAYVWPDQPDRLARLRAALDLADEPLVDRSDAAEWLERRLSQPWTGQCHLVYHTVAHQYFPALTKDRIARTMERAGVGAASGAPLAWFGMEADAAGEGAGLTLRLWPGDQRIALGRAGFHGQWIDWHRQ